MVNQSYFLKNVERSFRLGNESKAIGLTNETDFWNGQDIKVDNQQLINFGTCGYLGLETDRRLIEKSMDYASRFGTQFSVSRAYLKSNLLDELETRLSKIFNNKKVFVFSSTTLAHMSVLPVLISDKDLIILDKQVHFSVQTGTGLLASKKVATRMVKHNDMEKLEQYILHYKDRYDKIWYMVDGVYSMFGDVAPMRDINALMQKYEQLHVYVDDAHGMAWCGSNGSGAIFDDIAVPERVVLSSTLAKGFGATGGFVVFPTEEFYNKVWQFGGPLSYSHPLAPAILGASVAAGDILLSPEIEVLQQDLKDKIDYCNDLLESTNLPILSNPNTPINFIGVGELETGCQLNKKMIDDGFYVNLALFPTVPTNNTGMRFTITRHVDKQQIYNFVEALGYHYEQTLREQNTCVEEVSKAFNLKVPEMA
ncbi:MAG: aminotransferase class I/II-fold pyridoxal phosphate-dependent enzyme [Bacteroidota bacterium]